MPLSLTSRRNQICIFFEALDFVLISDASGFKILYIPFISVYNPFPKYLTPGLETMVSYVDFRISGTIYQTGARTIGYCTMVLPLNICHETDPLTIWMNLGNLNLFVIALLSW